MSGDDRLRELAHLAGIDSGYWDIGGTYHEASPDTLTALLEALGIAAQSETDIKASLHLLAHRDLSRPVPKTLVVRGQDGALALNLRQNQLEKQLSWTITQEDGTVSAGETWAGTLHDEGDRALEGQTMSCRRLVLPALPLGYHKLAVEIGNDRLETQLIMSPTHCYLPPAIANDERLWGISAQIYGLRSRRDQGIGDLGDVSLLARWAASQRADIVGLSPLHALFLSEPERVSPYSPSSRLFFNPLHLDVTVIEDLEQLAKEQSAQPPWSSNLVDYRAVAKTKLEVLERVYAHFCSLQVNDPDHPRVHAFRAFRQSRGTSLTRYATFEAIAERAKSYDWENWPAGLRDPLSQAVRDFAHAHESRVRFFEYMQWQADIQLARAAERTRADQMRIGLYMDLAISSHPSGSDVWSAQDTFARNVRIGAPPDPLGPEGQEWGVVPFNPRRLFDLSYMPFAELLRANMRHAGALRIDHVMGLQRLFWVPTGARASAGTYARYPIDDLLGVLALESHRKRCLVIGEDLGTVPEGFRGQMEKERILSYRVLFFERNELGFKRPHDYPRHAAACVTTHDLPTLRGFWSGDDLKIRDQLGLCRSDAERAEANRERAETKRLILEALSREELLPPQIADLALDDDLPEALAAAIHAFAARSSSALFIAQIEDLMRQEHQVNVPGTSTQYPNWQRRLPNPVEDLASSAAAQAITSAIHRERA